MEERNAPLLSVIVPVYNAEKYLARCLDSILCQTYTNLEVVCINDGSMDSSEAIIKEYVKKDCRVLYFSQINMGTAKTRCRGISICHGDFITFVDDDDYISPMMYEKMLYTAIEADSDICMCQFGPIAKGDTIPQSFYGHYQTLDFFREWYSKGHYVNVALCVLWNKIYRSKILKGIETEFVYPEDQEINDLVFSKNCKIVVIPEVLYTYNHHQDNVTSAPWPGVTLGFLDVLNKRCTVYHDADIICDTEILYCNMYVEYWMRAKAIGIRLPDKYYTYFKQMCFRLLPKRCGLKFYFRMFLFWLSPSLYIAIVKNKTKR